MSYAKEVDGLFTVDIHNHKLVHLKAARLVAEYADSEIKMQERIIKAMQANIDALKEQVKLLEELEK